MSSADIPTDPYAEARLALDKAHRAARSLEGGEFRRALMEARDVLHGLGDEARSTELAQAVCDKVEKALTDLDAGPLDEAEHLVEQARLDLSGTAPA